jgi:hypothetical protein
MGATVSILRQTKVIWCKLQDMGYTLNRVARGVCFTLAFAINPNLGCGTTDSGSTQWQYDEADMEAAVVGTFSGTAGTDAASDSVVLTIQRSAVPSGASPSSVGSAGLRVQCASRTFFVKTAGACISTSTMPVDGDLAMVGLASVHLTGQFTAYDTLAGTLQLSNGGGARLSATYQDGQFSAITYTATDGVVTLLSLQRS